MLPFPADELSNTATYFCKFANLKHYGAND